MSGRAVIYTRVSSSRQVENNSLGQQEVECREWCRQREITVDCVFVELGESAKNTNRKAFQRMFSYLERKQDSITHFVVLKLDRFGRSVWDDGQYLLKLQKWNITVVSVRDNLDSTPTGQFKTIMIQGLAQLDNQNRSQSSRTGMLATVQSGRWAWKAPLGFLNGRRGGPSLVHDPEHAPLIAQLFERVAEGHGLQSSVDWITVLGLRTLKGHKLSTSTASRLLHCPLYKGTISVPKWGISIDNAHPPISPATTWAKVQRVLAGNTVTDVPHSKNNPAFVLKKVIVCDQCGKPATASKSTGRSAKYGYYCCHRARGHFRIRADKADAQFLDLLDALIPNPLRMNLVESVFRDVWEVRNGSRANDTERLQTQLANLKSQKKSIIAQIRVFTPTDFETAYKEVEAEILATTSVLEQIETTELDVDVAISYLNQMLWNLPNLYQTGDLNSNTLLFRTIFPQGIKCSKTGLGTPVTHSLYSMLADESVSAERLASPTGFEPVLSP